MNTPPTFGLFTDYQDIYPVRNINIDTNVIKRHLSDRPENERRVLSRKKDLYKRYLDFPEIYLTKVDYEKIEKRIPLNNRFLNDPDFAADIIERTVLEACNNIDAFRGRTFRTIPNTDRLVLGSLLRIIQRDENTIKIKNSEPPPRSKDIELKKTSYITGVTYSFFTQILSIGIQTESYKLETPKEITDEEKKIIRMHELQSRIKSNLLVYTRQRSQSISIKNNPEEKKAVDSLRELISEKIFRKYMTYGFLVVKGESGRHYQIFRDKWHTKVWEKGTVVEEVCTRINTSKQNVPPTDNVIAFKTMIEADEEDFKLCGNVYKMKG